MKLLLGLLFIVSSAAMAETFDYSKKIGIGGSAGYGTPVFGNIFNHAADGGENWGLHLRYHTCESCGFEAAFTKYEFNDTKSALQVTDILYFKRLNPLARLTPVIGAGLGVVDITNYDPNSLKLGLKLRGGAEYAINKNFSLGANLDYQHVNKMLFAANLPSRNIHVVSAKIGLTWYFAGPKTEEASKPAPMAAPVAAAAAAEKDSDKDGVLDSKDKCPGTAEGVAVNAYGCAAEEKASVHLNVQFASGKAALASGYDQDLKDLATFMQEHPKTKVEIQGHTDNSGAKALNQKLSQSRADAVKAYLVNTLKVDGSRLTAKGYGDSTPVADNATPEGKQQNRRVIAVINE